MSAPPPAYNPPVNPDRRSLPEGWISRYDENYRAWYYVDTRAHPPRSSWDHPLGSPSPPQPVGYAPPANPPPSRPNYSSSNPSYQGQSYGGSQYNHPSQYQSGFPSGQQEQRGYSGAPPQGGYASYGYGGPPGVYGNQTWQQQQPPQPVYSQPPPQVTQQPPRGRGGGMGVGTAVLAGGAGLLGGALLANAFEDHEDRREQEAYDQGYGDGQDNDYDGGGDW